MQSLQAIQNNLPKKCQIIAVSKLQTVQQILDLYDQGQRHFAENYVQEALQKIVRVQKPDLHWHFIGHLQKNKVKDVVGKFAFIHSVDSFELAEVIEKQAIKKELKQKIFIQVNLAHEETKSGCDEKDLPTLLDAMQKLSHVEIVGLMTMPPLADDAEKSRKYFLKLKNRMVELAKDFPTLCELSMGTSSDYLVAASEGATFVRLGTILFGERKS